MSVFEIPELLEHVRKYLSDHDLAVCVRVNKTWCSLLAPFLWRSIPPRRPLSPTVSDFRDRDLFRRLVRDDYLATYHTPRAGELSVLSRCGPWIHELALFRIQLRCPPSQQEQELEQDQLSLPGSLNAVPEPSEQELLLHLLKHCPNLTSLTLTRWSADKQHMAFWRTLAAEILPRLKEFEALDVYGERFVEGLRSVFNHCPSTIQKLKLSLSHNFYSADSDQQQDGVEDAEDGDMEVGDPLVELKDLDVSALGPDRDWYAWSAFLRRSVCLESLTVSSIDRWWSQVLAKCVFLRRLHIQGCSMTSLGVLTSVLKNGGLSSLDDLVLRFSRFMSSKVNDQGLADMLSACRKGWRSVDVSVLYPRSADVLIKDHRGTLECLYAEETSWLASTQLYQFLSLCPNLHTFSILEDGAKSLPATPARFEADEFIDPDPVTNTLRPWPCESTLRVFRAKIARIPRPDMTHTYHGFPREEDGYQYDEFDEEIRLEEYPGQGRDIQHQVYERLSRFKQLEVLALGHDDRDTLSFSRDSNYRPDAQGVDVYFDDAFQYECLSMSLQRSGGGKGDQCCNSGNSGMELLAELKDLRELNVHRMATCIGVEEVYWMTQNWPKLRSVRGLKSEHEEERRADGWLKVNCPWIESEPCSFLRPGK